MGADWKILWESSTFEVREGSSSIGRKDADITIPEKSLSKEHARITRRGDWLEIADAGSTNGTSVNGRPVSGRMSLSPGDVIRLGGVELRVAGKVASAAPPAPAQVKGGARFTIVAGDGKGRGVTLSSEKPFTVGTKEENALALKGDGISRYHAEVLCERGVWVLKDLGSRNGTFVGDRKVDLHELAPGDEVRIGSVLLRFEEEPKPGALAALVPADPKALAKSPHLRRAILLVAVAGAALAIAFGRGSVTGGGTAAAGSAAAPGETQKIVHDVIQLLDKDDAIRGRETVGKALRKEGGTSSTLAALDQLAKVWLEHRSPIAFEWKGASEAIAKLVRDASPQVIDADCSEWLQKQKTLCEAEVPNAQLRVQADGAMSKGQNDLRGGKLKEGTDQLRDALELYRSMPPSSAFAPSSRDRATAVRKLLLDALRREGEACMAGKPPRWEDAIAFFAEARKFAETFDERKPVDEKAATCELNLRDEKALLEVVEIVQKTDEARYARARELLDGIAQSSLCYRDAMAYKHWFDADGLVRAAMKAYEKGAFDQARKLMEDATRVPDLRPEAVHSVRVRVERWAKVEESWRTGYEAEQKRDLARARSLFRQVLELETSRDNMYRQRAEKELASLDEADQSALDTALRAGIELLDGGKYADAYAKFTTVADKTAQGSPARGLIEDAVSRANKEKGLFKEANRIVVQNKKDRFPAAKDTLQLLGRFLPEKDPDRENAIQLLGKVK